MRLVIIQLRIRFEGCDRHPIEWKEQNDQEAGERQIDGDHPPRLAVPGHGFRWRGSACFSCFSLGCGAHCFLLPASIIALTLLPFAPRQGEIAEERCEDEEGDHGNRNRRTFPQLPARNAALEGQRCEQMR